ncbi:MAG: glycosyltransferase family 1 protein, partial [Dehalococcoidia bacterium]|nr:glycosyltransferase family 1 protein [Dehalococcoidia bacterium]
VGPLRIAIDATAVPRQMAGAGVYTYQLVRALARLANEHRLLVFARPGLFDDLSGEQLRVLHVDPPSPAARLAWEQTALPLLLRRLRIDVLHSPHHHTPLAARLDAAGDARRPRLVVTFHDVTFLLLRDRYPLARRLYMEGVSRAAARIADAIITPSETVRRDVIDKLGVPAERVVAIAEAAGPHFAPVDDDTVGRVRWKHRLPSRYILSVGSLEPGKNRGRLILAYRQLKMNGIDCPLVVAGQPAWRYEGDFELVRGLGLRDEITFLGYVPDDELPALYSGAALLAFPSLYEGFGLPVLEAMACGTPVVASNVSATAEVAGDAALLIDPRDVDALAAAMGRVLSDEALRADLRTRGLERAAQFSWERAARETLFLYELVAAKG